MILSRINAARMKSSDHHVVAAIDPASMIFLVYSVTFMTIAKTLKISIDLSIKRSYMN